MILMYPEFAKPLRMETDTTGEGLGAVLTQENTKGGYKPTAYSSQAETRYPVTELETRL